MPKPIHMPTLSAEISEGRITEWLKREGDEVAAGEVVAQVETDKATLDVEVSDGGVLLAIVVAKGATVPVGTPIGWVGQRGETIPVHASGLVSEAAPGAGSRAERGAHALSAPPPSTHRRVPASPAARRVARERRIDLATLHGSGPGGRIVVADVERASPGAASSTARAKSRRALPPRQTLREETLPLTPMRKAIARSLGTAKPGAPHLYLEISADMRRALALRAQFLARGEADVTLNDLVVKAAADALSRHPEINASWSGEGIVRHGGVHVAMAVALEDGLITPVLRDADRRSLLELARSAKELARRARDRRLRPDEYQGATFTVSNLGMFGIESFYAIVNPPEAAILSVGAVQRAPWVDEETGQLTVMERCRFGLSGDHRVIDGATGARFLQTFKAVIESPDHLVAPATP